MKDVKEWFLHKCRIFQNGSTSDDTTQKCADLRGGLTPKTIPDFEPIKKAPQRGY
jgi:hypothetical protein